MELMEEEKKLLERIRLFVLDLDGTYYLGDRIIEGALSFTEAVKASGRRFLFLTNNSSKAPEDYIEKLGGMGCKISREEIMTSGDVMIRYLKDFYEGKTVYLLGTEPLRRSFDEAGILLTEEQPDIVVVGFDQSLTYEKLTRACTFIRNGALFLATHLDLNCPVPGGLIPDCGAICGAITLSTGIEPKYLGKPFKETVDAVLERTGASLEETAFVGDRLYTDVASGTKNGAAGILVLTGEAKIKDVIGMEFPPDAIFESLGEMARFLKGEADDVKNDRPVRGNERCRSF